MSAHATTSARALAWERRRRAFAQGWADFRETRSGVIGLVISLVFLSSARRDPRRTVVRERDVY